MPRERWFFAQDHRRRGPVPLETLVESVLGQAEPRSVLVWRKGLVDWARVEDVPELEKRLTANVERKTAEEAARRAAVPAPTRAQARRLRAQESKPGSSALVYGGIAAGVVALALLAWLFWPRAQPPAPAALPLGGTTTADAPAVVIRAQPQPTPLPAAPPTPIAAAAPVTRPATTTPNSGAAALSEREGELSAADIKRLRGVASWAGDTLKLTVYNGTSWRVTELYLKISRFKDDDFVEDEHPILLLPPGAAVDSGVADLLRKVAPDRKKPGLNPADTGAFEGKAGQQPENFRWEIGAARGYARK
jgi:GYF domain 2